jgi:RimJ/RimL family protein N-acetyltransferase
MTRATLGTMDVRCSRLAWPDDEPDVVTFLTSNEWPFHADPNPTVDDVGEMSFVGDDVVSFWIADGEVRVGLIRVFDLDDIDDGSPLFDVRIAETHRGRGVGRAAVGWVTAHLFATYPNLRRIEATTRADNAAMQAVFAATGYQLEGRLREAWKQADGTWHDSLAYGILRREHTPATD